MISRYIKISEWKKISCGLYKIKFIQKSLELNCNWEGLLTALNWMFVFCEKYSFGGNVLKLYRKQKFSDMNKLKLLTIRHRH